MLTNAIAVVDDAAAARAGAGGGLARGAAGTRRPRVAIDSFEAGSLFAPACDSASKFREPALDATGGIDGRGAALLDFAIGLPTAQHPDVSARWSTAGRAISPARTGLVFSIRGDGAYRVWVQVRDENPASADEGTEWWFASVKTGPEWRRVAVPFARLRSINPKTDGRLDLDKVRALVFVLDKGSVKPGTAGRIWIDELGVY